MLLKQHSKLHTSTGQTTIIETNNQLIRTNWSLSLLPITQSRHMYIIMPAIVRSQQKSIQKMNWLCHLCRGINTPGSLCTDLLPHKLFICLRTQSMTWINLSWGPQQVGISKWASQMEWGHCMECNYKGQSLVGRSFLGRVFLAPWEFLPGLKRMTCRYQAHLMDLKTWSKLMSIGFPKEQSAAENELHLRTSRDIPSIINRNFFEFAESLGHWPVSWASVRRHETLRDNNN